MKAWKVVILLHILATITQESITAIIYNIMQGKQNKINQALLKRSPGYDTHYNKTRWRGQTRKNMILTFVMSGFLIFFTCCHSRKIDTKCTLRSLDTLEKIFVHPWQRKFPKILGYSWQCKYPKILGHSWKENILRSLDTWTLMAKEIS